MTQTKLNLDEIHSLELDILKYIDVICKENEIQYSLAYGTLLGAIRHKGFIPWDDDIDIFMLREDYNKFIEVLSKKRDGRYALMSLKNDKNYCYDYAKVVDASTRIEMDDIVCYENDGLWVDVFPLDSLSSFPKIHKLFITFFVICNSLSLHFHFPHNKRSYIWYPLWAISRLFGPRSFAIIVDALAKWGKNKKYIGRIGGATIRRNYYFEREWCFPMVKVPFEGYEFQAFGEYDKLLTFEFGDYMKLPPEDKRICHPVVAYMR